MKGTIRATVKVAGHQRECRFVKGTPARVIKAWRQREHDKLRRRYPVSSAPKSRDTGTLAADVDRYLPLIGHMSENGRHRRAEIRAWLPCIGHKNRYLVTREDILAARSAWAAQGLKPKTINNRVSALNQLYVYLDGDDAWSPCEGVKFLRSDKVPIQVVNAETVNAVCQTLLERAAQYRGGRTRTGAPGGQHALKDRARLMVMASTGKRPCEIARAQPGDVDLQRRVWVTRDAKRGSSPGVYLNDDMLAAWEAFFEADAWGEFQRHFARRLRDAGWPAHVKPYCVRHSTWIEASERGADLADIQVGCGHKHQGTTRRHYVPVLNSRMQRLSELLDGRFGWARQRDKAESA